MTAMTKKMESRTWGGLAEVYRLAVILVICVMGGESRLLNRQAGHCFLSLANIIQTKPATIDINGFAGDIASFVTGQKHDGVGHILYVAKPAKRGSW